MNPTTPATGAAPTAANHPSSISTTPGSETPLRTDSFVPLHGSPRRLRTVRRELLYDLAHYARATKSEAARHYLAKLKGCGETPIGRGVSLVRHIINGQVIGGTIRGVRTCMDRMCPVCAAKIEGREAREVRAALLHMHHAGTLETHQLILFTATMRHKFDDDHARNFQNLVTVLTKLQSQSWWKAAVAGSIVKLEIEGTLDDPRKSGLHPHAHVLLALASDTDPEKLATKVHAFFKAGFEKLAPGENRIGWHRDPSATWWMPTSYENVPQYLAEKRWTIAEEVTASGAKNGGFWERPTGDLVAVWSLLKGVCTSRVTGVFRSALATIRTRQKIASVTVVRLSNAAWSTLPSEVRDPLSTALDNPAADPTWIAWTVAHLNDLTVSTQEALLGLIADPQCPPEAINAIIAAVTEPPPHDLFGLVVDTLSKVRASRFPRI